MHSSITPEPASGSDARTTSRPAEATEVRRALLEVQAALEACGDALDRTIADASRGRVLPLPGARTVRGR